MTNRTCVLTAVFGASGFEELTCWTGDSGVEQPPVIWIYVQLARDFLLCHCACEEQKVIYFIYYNEKGTHPQYFRPEYDKRRSGDLSSRTSARPELSCH